MVVKDACANQTRYEPAIHCFLGKKNELTEIYKVSCVSEYAVAGFIKNQQGNMQRRTFKNPHT